MNSKLKVSRFDPETMGSGQRRWDEFELDLHPSATVLDALIQIREEVDGTLALRRACRPSICAPAECEDRRGPTRLQDPHRRHRRRGRVRELLTMGNHAHGHQDLVVALDPFVHKVRKSIRTPPRTKTEQGEFVVTTIRWRDLFTAIALHRCAVHGVSDCRLLEVDRAISAAPRGQRVPCRRRPRDDQRGRKRLKELNRNRSGYLGLHPRVTCVESVPRTCADGSHHGDARHGH